MVHNLNTRLKQFTDPQKKAKKWHEQFTDQMKKPKDVLES